MKAVHKWTQAMGGVVWYIFPSPSGDSFSRWPTSTDDETLCGRYSSSAVAVSFKDEDVTCKRCRRLLRMKDAYLWHWRERRRVAHGGRWRHASKRLSWD